MKRFLYLSMAVIFLLGLFPASAAASPARLEATTWYVMSDDDDDDGACDENHCSLREAVKYAAAGDSIAFDFGVPTTITLGGTEILINKSLTIYNPDASLLTISGAGLSRVFNLIKGVGDPAFSVTMSGLTIRNGGTPQFGGGIQLWSDTTLTLNNCVIGPGNIVTVAGGGIANYGGILTLNRSSVIGNHGTGAVGGAGIFTTNSGSTTLVNSTVSGNVTNNDGGGMFFDYGTTGSLIHSTITNNTANDDAVAEEPFPYGSVGGIYSFGNVTIRNSIVAGNTDKSYLIDPLDPAYHDPIPDIKGTFTSLGGNLIGDGTGSSGWIAGDMVGDSVAQIIPQLGELLLNAPGHTPTHALLAGSPAINAAPICAATTDQRGVNRPQGSACDIGAYEAKGPITVNSFLQDGAEGTSSLCTLGAAILAANEDKVVDGCSAGFGDDTIILPAGTYDLTAIAGSNHGGDVGLPEIWFENLTIRGVLVDGQPASIINRPATLADGITPTPEFRLMTVLDGVNLTLENVQFSGGIASVDTHEIGGALLGKPGATINLSHTLFSGNQADSGGAVYAIGPLNITDSTFSNNTGGISGGAFENTTSRVTITRSTFNGNSSLGSSGNGGVMYVNCFDISDSTFSGNHASFGGAIYSGYNCEKTITGSTFVNNNDSITSGGAIKNMYGTLTITNSTFTGNLANNGGGINHEYGNLTLTNVSMSGNDATNGDNLYLIYTQPNQITITNTILANPTSSNNCHVSTNYNLPADGGGNLLTSACSSITSRIGNPDLQALANNGGPTQTMALGANSQALEIGVAASCPATDQRGVTRPQPEATNCDAGAFESSNTPPTDTTAPVVTVPDNMTVEATSSSGAVATFTATAMDDVDGALTPTCIPASNTTFPFGTTTVTCTAADAATNEGSATFTVTVQDTTLPVVTVPADISVPAEVAPSETVVTFSASATDNIDGPLTPICDHLSGSTFPVGSTYVTCSATDTHGNAGHGYFYVTVNPSLHVTQITGEYKAGHSYTYYGWVTINTHDNLAISKVAVTVEWSKKLPGDTAFQTISPRSSPTAMTNRLGVAKFVLRGEAPISAGTYKLCVTNVAKAGWTYASAQDLDDCHEIVVP